nr:Tetracycline_Resistance_MFS_Efflux_Pump [uncultured bacterium]
MLPVILTTIVLDAAGIGLTLPILPRLLQEVGHTSELGWLFGAFLSLYALMQFLFSPVLGGLSDRFGRKPVLLVSLGGAAVDYLFMAFAPSLWLLFIGRAIAGITGANMAVASAVITDLTPEDQRARRFGQLSACFGIGFIAGPAIGGLLGEVSIRAPFVAAAFLNAVNLALAFFTLRETRRRDTEASESKNSFSPLGTLRWVSGLGGLLPLIGAYIVLAFVGEVGGTIWVLYGQDKFAWSPITIGISLAGFGLFHAGIQAFVAGPISERWGERRALLISITTDSIAYILIAIATEGWMVFALLPLFCLGRHRRAGAAIAADIRRALRPARQAARRAIQHDQPCLYRRSAIDQHRLFHEPIELSGPGMDCGRSTLLALPARLSQPLKGGRGIAEPALRKRPSDVFRRTASR